MVTAVALNDECSRADEQLQQQWQHWMATN